MPGTLDFGLFVIAYWFVVIWSEQDRPADRIHAEDLRESEYSLGMRIRKLINDPVQLLL